MKTLMVNAHLFARRNSVVGVDRKQKKPRTVYFLIPPGSWKSVLRPSKKRPFETPRFRSTPTTGTTGAAGAGARGVEWDECRCRFADRGALDHAV
jgi:hypothetical protein